MIAMSPSIATAAVTGAPAAKEGLAFYQGCGLCGRCEAACPHGVAAADAVRCIRYYNDAERLPAMARREFARLDLARSLAHCQDCGSCERACPRRIPVRRELRRAWDAWVA
jgi:predicted aldo/keto reductase-like oxidoreductase